MLKLLIYSVFITITIPAISVFAETNSIPTYKAVYDIRYKGTLVGESEITLVEGQTHGSYIYASKSNTKGLLRLIAPKELLEKSEFSYDNNLIKPIIRIVTTPQKHICTQMTHNSRNPLRRLHIFHT